MFCKYSVTKRNFFLLEKHIKGGEEPESYFIGVKNLPYYTQQPNRDTNQTVLKPLRHGESLSERPELAISGRPEVARQTKKGSTGSTGKKKKKQRRQERKNMANHGEKGLPLTSEAYVITVFLLSPPNWKLGDREPIFHVFVSPKPNTRCSAQVFVEGTDAITCPLWHWERCPVLACTEQPLTG